MAARHFYEFGGYRLDLLAQRLYRGEEVISLTPKAFDTLLLLVRHRGRTLDKRELMQALWPDTFVEESNLAQQVFTLRKLLGKQPNGRPYIDTIPRRGYQFVAPVEETRDDLAMHGGTDRRRRGARLAAGRRGWALAAGAVALSVAGGTLWQRGSVAAPPAEAPAIRSVAVLPLSNLTGDSDQDFLAEGITDTLTTNLARIGSLRVISQTSVMAFKRDPKPLREIGRELKVDAIVEGGVDRLGSRIRLDVRLVDTSTDRHLWTQTYERDVQEIAGLQADVARAIAAETRVTIAPTERALFATARSVSPKVFEAYLKGRFLWNRRTDSDVRKAVTYFEEAIRDDPTYAPAYAGLADSYIVLSQWSVPGDEAWAKARAAAERALRLDESLAEGHTTRAAIAMNYEWDWRRAERAYRRALELNPGYATAHHWYGYYLMLMRRFADAEVELKRARDLDPLSAVIDANLGFRHYLARDYDTAIAHWEQVLELDRHFSLGHGYMALARIQQEKYPDALVSLQASMAGSPAPSTKAILAHTFGRMGKARQARQLLAQLLDGSSGRFISPYYVSLVYVGLGETDKALDWLERAYQERSGPLLELNVDPMFDPLRGDPRFAAILRKMGLEG
jgi:TolB-like protein/DNA-binding winged helix-turn-helix (wHTH) protein/tetratricopeptide (TPR) repeat protein